MCKEVDVGRRFTPPRFPKVMRAGKTRRDKERGAWGARFFNRDNDPGRNGGKRTVSFGKKGR